MDDRFMHELRRDPDSGFGRGLHEKLRNQETPRVARALRPVPALALGLVAAVVFALIAFPSVRVSAQQMLDLFRVRKFAAVQFDESRIEKLRSLEHGDGMLIFDHQEELQKPGPTRAFSTVEEAAAAAGYAAARPTWLPDGLVPDSASVDGEGAARLTVSEAKLRALLDALELRDVSVPGGIDGQVIEVRKPRVLAQRFTKDRRHAVLVQAPSPEVSVPAGLDVERLAEIGLRVLGLDAGEARRVAQATDWRSTLIVPLPLNASTFRQVTIHGQPGLLVTSTEKSSDGDHRREGSMALWTENDRVFAVMGNLDPDDALRMAESVR